MNSNQKGKRGERELANLLREHGFDEARRGQQYNGIEGQDVIGLPRLHIECKRDEALSIYNAMNQSIRDAQSESLPFEEEKIPVVMHRKNRKPWLVTMTYVDWKELFLKYFGLADGPYFMSIFTYGELKETLSSNAKVTQRLNIYKEIDALKKESDNPVVFCHSKGDGFYITMLFTEWIEFYKEWIK